MRDYGLREHKQKLYLYGLRIC